MKIALLGYGKMGKAIEAFALKRGHTIEARIDLSNAHEIDQIRQADVAIEFSQPDAVVHNLLACFERKIPVVCGTTGWLQHKATIEDACKKNEGTLFYASNYSLGVNLFFKLNDFLAQLMNRHEGYDVLIDEIHHTQKKDAPSGTAITLAEGIIKALDRKKSWTLGEGENPDPSSLVINSSRVDPTPGTHTVRYTSPVDNLEIRHTAHSRDGFALGALMVAEWIKEKKGVLGMSDFFKL